jgi:hypothetical protein
VSHHGDASGLQQGITGAIATPFVNALLSVAMDFSDAVLLTKCQQGRR